MTDVEVLELFRVEVENQVARINQGLVQLERNTGDAALLEALMRASHSIKGAARIVRLPAAVTLAHAMEDCFVALQQGATLPPEGYDELLAAVDRLAASARVDGNLLQAWLEAHSAEFETLAQALREHITAAPPPAAAVTPTEPAPPPATTPNTEPPTPPAPSPAPSGMADSRLLRINAEHLDQIMGLAAEALVESQRLKPFALSLLRLRRGQAGMASQLDELQELLHDSQAGERSRELMRELQRQFRAAAEYMSEQESRAGVLDQRLTRLAGDIYREATRSRMRAFAEGVAAYPRMVRDLARELGKEVQLVINGAATQVDRDIMESLLAPLDHLLRNAVDHAIEPPAERLAAGKPAMGTVWLEARHHAGMLRITVRDDGRGIAVEALRAEVIRRGLVSPELGQELSAEELFNFLYLPNFTLSARLTEISGRGVGLDIVQTAVHRVRGSLHTHSEPGRGSRFDLQLPLTLSVLRGLVVHVADAAYAFPLARVDRVVKLPAREVRSLEGREYFELDGRSVGLVSARQILRLPASAEACETLQVVLLTDHDKHFGLVVDRLLTECSLVVQPLDPALGKLRNIASATLLEDGAPALILDVDDLFRSIDSLVSSGRLQHALPAAAGVARPRKQVLVVDDSFTVREVERKLLENRGYRVDIAVDGMDGWKAVQGGTYDLLLTDVDMPRMNGIDLVAMVRKHPLLKSLPVMIVSYKDREEDRQSGLEVGADYYLTKSSFQDDTLLEAVENLIGEP